MGIQIREAGPPYDGEGARRVGGRWNSKGKPVIYMSENRALAVLEILVHLSSSLPDKYVLGVANIPDDVSIEKVHPGGLSSDWMTLNPGEQLATKRIGDAWIEERRSAVLAVPSVIVGELNYVLNPAHPAFKQISFSEPVPFHFDIRLIARRRSTTEVSKPQAGLI